MIKILDYGMGNCGSIYNMLRYLGAEAEVVNQSTDLEDASAIILPGVGSFDHGMKHLEPFRSELEEKVLLHRIPFLGVCLGMQLLLERSEEGELSGLGWIEGRVKRFAFPEANVKERLVVPHMGWNEVWPKNSDSLINNDSVGSRDRFYFVHSYHAADVPEQYQMASCHYGYDFTCGVHKENIFGVQFHPEKSHKFGKQLFKHFIEIAKC